MCSSRRQHRRRAIKVRRAACATCMYVPCGVTPMAAQSRGVDIGNALPQKNATRTNMPRDGTIYGETEGERKHGVREIGGGCIRGKRG